MKCTQCGNTSFIEGLSFPIRVDEYWKIAPTFKMYVCDKCGHVEFFYSGAIEENNEISKLNDEFQKSTSKIKERLENLQRLQEEMKEKAYKAYEDETRRLESIIADETITVAVYKKAQSDLEELKKFKFIQKIELSGLNPDDFPNKREIRNLEAQYAELEKEQVNKINLVKRKYKF